MIKLGVIGYPLKHTLSPVMQNAALKELNLEGSYLPYEIAPEKLEESLKRFIADGFSGYNVTIPFKIDIIPFLYEITPEAEAVGAVNTVIITDDKKTTGDNTDVYGFMSAFNKDELDYLKGKKAAIIGAGGAARAVAAGLIKMEISNIFLFSRRMESVTSTCQVILEMGCYSIAVSGKTINNINLKDIDLLINASPAGMYPDADRCPLDESILDQLNTEAIVYDLIYRPRDTKLLKIASEKGFKTYNGTEMLVQQGAKAFEKWTSKKPPVDVMREKLLEALQNE